MPAIQLVGEVADGKEAVHQTQASQPDVVLMDVQMPGMDGLEATRLIKDKQPEVRVVVLTMYPGHQAGALEAGADAFLVKGCSAEELLDTMMHPGEKA